MCDVSVYPITSLGVAPLSVIATGTVVTVAEVRTGDPWIGACSDPNAQGSTWYRIVAINGTPASALFGVEPTSLP